MGKQTHVLSACSAVPQPTPPYILLPNTVYNITRTFFETINVIPSSEREIAYSAKPVTSSS